MIEKSQIEDVAGQIVELEAELESAGNAMTSGDDLARMRAALHEWVETIVGVVSSPGSGRVALIHENGVRTSIASPDLPYLLVRPVSFGGE